MRLQPGEMSDRAAQRLALAAGGGFGGKSQSVEPAFGAESLWARAQPPPVRCTLCWALLNFNEHLVLLALFSIVN